MAAPDCDPGCPGYPCALRIETDPPRQDDDRGHPKKMLSDGNKRTIAGVPFMARLAGENSAGKRTTLHLLKMAGAQAVRARVKTPARRAQGLAFAPNRGICLPGILAIAM